MRGRQEELSTVVGLGGMRDNKPVDTGGAFSRGFDLLQGYPDDPLSSISQSKPARLLVLEYTTSLQLDRAF
ncbi:hypothetical protein NUU61_008909 [Penicillium alfredii]|uniref:Uncharacterized protein n=1 Tax=Penicillium alfredii TaxID=1506179 RepID=A0A9W9JWS0_9EURO|nr:uncharacterized protein NUU61_008909 [Penicillium alfredii]KAJ5084330.1 hypothetical protein NUU61_008909 [Penicillium alfredii]